MAKPVRLTLSRRSGADLQALSRRTNGLDAVVVSRPGKWGNPFHVDEYGRAKAMAMYKSHIEKRIASVAPQAKKLDIEELRGKNLACWCAPDLACHADILLALANGTKRAAGRRRGPG